MLDFISRCVNSTLCNFDKSPTPAILAFELFVLCGVVAALLVLPRLKDQIPKRFLLMSIGVLIFELFTAPMWHNFKMGWWAYIYRDVSWILTLGWSAMMLSVVLIVDRIFKHWKEWKRFILYLATLTVLVSFFETVVVNIGIRSYSPEVLASTSNITLLNVPIELIYYTPVFTTLVISFYKYWSFALDQTLLVPVKRSHWLRDFCIAFLGVFLFEMMIEPMVDNQNFPQWSYWFHDISIIMTGVWIVVIWLTTELMNRLLIHYSVAQKFLVTLLVIGAIALPLESWFIIHGYRVYGPSAVANFTGFTTPITQVPVEVAFAIPCYMALVIGFIRYWETLLDNQL
ncbi:MAG: hypothetical protein SFY66_05180 [Oculatellaceae cyanobacterium bins.114]|nr:hypothetical protein [Oculatellaceae cyanobacterium bins.114]